MPPRSTARRRHLQPVPQAHPLLGSLFPGLKKEEVELAAERIKLYGQREVIEILDGEVIAGWLEYLACVEAKVVPAFTEIEEPADVLSYVIRSNIPRHLSKLDRACIAVLGREHYQAGAKERAREGNRRGGLAKAGKSRDQGSRDQLFEGERWWETAARVVGTTPGAVRRLAQIRRAAPDVFEAVRARRVEVLRDARDLMLGLAHPEARAQALALRDEDPRAPIARIIAEVSRSRRPQQPAPRRSKTSGASWQLYSGPMEVESLRIADETIDLVYADIEYGKGLLGADDIIRLRSKAEHLARIADAPVDKRLDLVKQLLSNETQGTIKATEAVVEALNTPSSGATPLNTSDGPSVGPPDSGTSHDDDKRSSNCTKTDGAKSSQKSVSGHGKKSTHGTEEVVEVSLTIGADEPTKLPVDGKLVRVRVSNRPT